MATASHAARLELRQTLWVMQAVGEDGQWENTALEGFERYGLITTVTAQDSRSRCLIGYASALEACSACVEPDSLCSPKLPFGSLESSVSKRSEPLFLVVLYPFGFRPPKQGFQIADFMRARNRKLYWLGA